MKLFKSLAIGALIAMSVVGCSRVPQGNVGVKVYTLGNDKGPDEEVLTMGRYWIPPMQELHLFPIYTQNYVWTATATKGSENDESITFQDTQGLTINSDIGIEFSIDPEKVALLFQKYRLGVNEVIDGPLRNYVRDSFVQFASMMSVEDIYGGKKTELINQVQDATADRFKEFGIIVTKVYWIDEMRIPASVKEGINAKVVSTQKAIQRENELRQAEAEAEKAVAEAEGLARSEVARAEGDAEAIRLRGEMLRRYPEVLQQQAIEKWSGDLPRFMGGDTGAVPFINVDPAN